MPLTMEKYETKSKRKTKSNFSLKATTLRALTSGTKNNDARCLYKRTKKILKSSDRVWLHRFYFFRSVLFDSEDWGALNFWRIYIDSMFVLISWRQKRISDAIISIIIAKPHTQILDAHFDKKNQKKFGTFQIYANVFSEQKIGLFRLQNTHTHRILSKINGIFIADFITYLRIRQFYGRRCFRWIWHLVERELHFDAADYIVWPRSNVNTE